MPASQRRIWEYIENINLPGRGLPPLLRDVQRRNTTNALRKQNTGRVLLYYSGGHGCLRISQVAARLYSTRHSTLDELPRFLFMWMISVRRRLPPD